MLSNIPKKETDLVLIWRKDHMAVHLKDTLKCTVITTPNQFEQFDFKACKRIGILLELNWPRPKKDHFSCLEVMRTLRCWKGVINPPIILISALSNNLIIQKIKDMSKSFLDLANATIFIHQNKGKIPNLEEARPLIHALKTLTFGYIDEAQKYDRHSDSFIDLLIGIKFELEGIKKSEPETRDRLFEILIQESKGRKVIDTIKYCYRTILETENYPDLLPDDPSSNLINKIAEFRHILPVIDKIEIGFLNIQSILDRGEIDIEELIPVIDQIKINLDLFIKHVIYIKEYCKATLPY